MFSLNSEVTFVSFQDEIKLDRLWKDLKQEEEDGWNGLPCSVYAASIKRDKQDKKALMDFHSEFSLEGIKNCLEMGQPAERSSGETWLSSEETLIKLLFTVRINDCEYR